MIHQAQEINHLISQQPTAMEAVRLKCFLQSKRPGLTTSATEYLNQRQVSCLVVQVYCIIPSVEGTLWDYSGRWQRINSD